MRRTLLGLVFLAFALPLHAQTVTSTLVYDMNDTLANVQSYQNTLKIGTGPAQTISPTCVSKSGPGFTVECTAPVPGTVPSGTQYTLTLSNNAGITAVTQTQGAGPAVPVNVKITIIVSVP